MSAKGNTRNTIPTKPTDFADTLSSGTLDFLLKKLEVLRLSTCRMSLKWRIISSLSLTFHFLKLHGQKHFGACCSVSDLEPVSRCSVHWNICLCWQSRRWLVPFWNWSLYFWVWFGIGYCSSVLSVLKMSSIAYTFLKWEILKTVF